MKYIFTVSLCLIFILQINTLTNAQTTKTVGVSGADYTTLKQAFDAINNGSLTGTIVLNIIDNTAETATAALNASGNGSASYTSVLIFPSVSGKTISGNLTAPLIDLNGADNVTLDGRVNHTGSTVSLTIVNESVSTNAGTSTIRFISDANGNNIKYCNIWGSSLSTSGGIILFSSAASSGNDNNILEYNNITNNNDNRPVRVVYAYGTSGMENDHNYIRNNNIFDFLNPSNASDCIHLSVYNTAWTIAGNSFYETTTFAPTADVGYQFIYTYNSGTSYSIDGNYFGGSGPLCSGTWTKTTGNNHLSCIFINNQISTCTNSITNNTIKGFSFHNSGNGIFAGIVLYCSSSENGVITGNTIGSATGTGSVTIHNSGANGTFNGITSFGDNDVSHNTIGSVTLEADDEFYFNFNGISITEDTESSCSHNLIGSETTANSIICTSISSIPENATFPGQYQTMRGIYVPPNSDHGILTISDNIIANLTNNIQYEYITLSTIPVSGIFAGDAELIIRNNSIHDLTVDYYANSMVNNIFLGGAVTGIWMTVNQTRTDIVSNEIFGLNIINTTNRTGHLACTGIQLMGNTNQVDVTGNYIHDFNINTSVSYSKITGIQNCNSVASFYNNIVALGHGVTSSAGIAGIYDFYSLVMTGSRSVLFNTVDIGGSSPAVTGGSYAYYSNYNNTRIVNNNIFYNSRSGGTATSHYSIGLANNTSLTIDYNDYFATGTNGALGDFNGTAKASLAAWQSSTGGDANSQVTNPLFVLTPPATAHDLTPTSTSLVGTTGTGITTDYDGDTRSITYPAMGALEYTVFPPVEVTATSGYNGPSQYFTLKTAFDKINDGTHKGAITIKLKGNTIESASATLNASADGNSDYSSVLIYPAFSGLTVSGNVAAPLINLNGADDVTIDGRVNGTGISKDLSIMNTSTSSLSGTSAIRFSNDACNNTVKYCTLKGSPYGTSTAILLFTTAGTGSGNDNNTVDNNDITCINDANRTPYVILSTGTSGSENSGNLISNNNLYNFMLRNTYSEGIVLADNNSGWTISGNSFYETALFETTTNSAGYTMIKINNTGSGYVITHNYIGGTADSCGGTPLTKSSSPQYTNVFNGISLQTGSGDASSIQGNVISKINWNNQSGTTISMISVGGSGSYNIGTETGNVIGSAAGNGSITLTSSGSNGGGIIGMSLGSTAGTTVVSNNVIGSITTHNPAAFGTSIFAIHRGGAATTVIDGNIIGSTDPSTTNSLYASSPATEPFQFLIGIENTGAGDLTISNNTIAKLRDNNVCTFGYLAGIFSDNGTCTITGNSIHDLSQNNLRTDVNHWASMMGIRMKNTSASHNISSNTIYNLVNTNAAFAGAVTGIYLEGSASVNTITGNFIHHLSVNASSTAATLYGIKAAGGTLDCSNNIVSLGGNTATTIYGIWDHGSSGTTGNYYFNTVYTGGAPSAGSRNSCAFYSNSNGAAHDIRNNLFVNARSNSGASGKHYAAYFNYGSPGTISLDYNDYHAPGTGGKTGYYNSADVTVLPLISGKDEHSLAINPSFTGAGGTVAADYTPQSTTILAITGTAILTDYSGSTRSLSAPSMGAWEVPICINPSGGGEIAQDQTICSGFVPGPLNSVHPASGETGTLEYKWQYSIIDPANPAFVETDFMDIADSGDDAYSPGSLSQNNWYRRSSRVGCMADWTGAATSNIIKVTVNPLTAISSQSTAGQSQCLNSSFTAITVTATGINLSYQWYSNTTASISDGNSLGTANGAQTNSYTPQSATAGTLYYYCEVKGDCGTDITSAVSGEFEVYPASDGGVVAGDSPVCNGNTSTLTLTGQVGNVLRWQSAILVSGSWSWTNIPATAGLDTYTSGALTQNTRFRAVVKNETCTSATSSFFLVTVNPVSVGGTVSSEQEICYNTKPASLVLINNTGNVIRWEKSADENFSSPISIAVTAITLTGNTIGNLTVSTYFRAVVKSGVCSEANSSSVLITVDPSTDGGAVSGTSPVCAGNTVELTLDGQTGTVLKWQSAVYAGSAWTWSDVSGTAGLTTYTSEVLNESTRFRVVVQSGVCPAVNSANKLIVVRPNPTFTSGSVTTPVCFGDEITFSAEGLLPIVNNTFYYKVTYGTDIITGSQTELSDLDGKAGFTTSGFGTGGYDFELTSITVAGCTTSFTGQTATFVVNPLPTAAISGGSGVCEDATPPEITFTGSEGTEPYTFTYTLNDGEEQTVTTSAGSSVNVAQPTITSGEFVYKLVKVEDENGCSQEQTGTETITVEPAPVEGTLAKTPDATWVCQGGDVSAKLTAGSGGNGTDLLEYRTQNGSGWANWLAYTSENNISTTGLTGVEIRTCRTADHCSNSSYNTIGWDMDITPPEVLTKTGVIITLPPSGSHNLLPSDLLTTYADAGSGILSVTIVPPKVICTDIGTKTISVTVKDNCSNQTITDLDITVVQGTTLAPWENCNTSPGAGGTSTFSPCTGAGAYYLSTTGQSTTTSDVMHFVYQEIGTTGTIIARLADVKNDGWAGVMMRESCAPGSKTVLFKTRLYNPNVLVGYRKFTDKAMVNMSQVYQQIRWMKIQRNGNIFQVFVSYNGTTWQRCYTVTIEMNTTILAGIFVENYRASRTTEAWFDHVELYAGLKSDIDLNNYDSVPVSESPDFLLYPNPASHSVTIILSGIDPFAYSLHGINATLLSTGGKSLKQFSVTEAETHLDLDRINPGVYIVRLEDKNQVLIKKLVVQ